MRAVTWGDFIMSSVIVSIVMGLPAVLSVVFIRGLVGGTPVSGIDTTYLVLIAAGFVCSFLIVRAHPGPMSDFGPAWAWAAAILSVPALAAAASALGFIGYDTFRRAVSIWMLDMSVATFVIVLSIYLRVRDSAVAVDDADLMDL